MEDPPTYSVAITPIPENWLKKTRKYVFRKDVHIFLFTTGDLIVYGTGFVTLKDKVVPIDSDNPLLLSCNVADIEAYSYYNYNGSSKDHFRIYGSDGSIILQRGKNVNCVLL